MALPTFGNENDRQEIVSPVSSELSENGELSVGPEIGSFRDANVRGTNSVDGGGQSLRQYVSGSPVKQIQPPKDAVPVMRLSKKPLDPGASSTWNHVFRLANSSDLIQ